MIQEILVILLFVGAVYYLIKPIFSKSNNDGCASGCSGCSSDALIKLQDQIKIQEIKKD